MKVFLFTAVFLFTLGATAQGGTPLPAKNSASILFAIVVLLAVPGVRLLTRRDRGSAREETKDADGRTD